MIRDVALVNYDNTANIPMFSRLADISPDSAGVKWALFDLDGWNGGLDVRPAVFERPFQDGAIVSDFAYAPRTIELHGGFIAPTDVIAVQAVRRLLGSVEIRDSSFHSLLRRLYVSEFAPATSDGYGFVIDFRRNGQPAITPHANGLAYEFSIPLLCPDGRKLSYTSFHAVQANATVTPLAIVSQGDTPTNSVLRIVGPITNPVVTHDRSGWAFRIIGSLGAGSYIDVDTRLHTVAGPLSRANVPASAQWPPILPGNNGYYLGGSGGSAASQLEMFWNDAFQ